MTPEIPLPPVEYRRLVTHDDNVFELPSGGVAYPEIAPEQYRSVFDFGCGCGRVARRLLWQTPRPKRYVGIDIHSGMIEWCQRNLTPIDRGFQFHHHDVYSLSLAPQNSRQMTSPLPARDHEFSLFIAHSVFTHLLKQQTEFYLKEVARILAPGGIAYTTWFLFDKATFPMMFDFQVSLFINEVDPSNAVIFDWRWLLETLAGNGLRITKTIPPSVPGFQWQLFLAPEAGEHEFPLAPERSPYLCGGSPVPTGAG